VDIASEHIERRGFEIPDPDTPPILAFAPVEYPASQSSIAIGRQDTRRAADFNNSDLC